MGKKSKSLADRKRQKMLEKKLIVLSDLCFEFQTAYQKYLNVPDDIELIKAVANMENACSDYLRDLIF